MRRIPRRRFDARAAELAGLTAVAAFDRRWVVGGYGVVGLTLDRQCFGRRGRDVLTGIRDAAAELPHDRTVFERDAGDFLERQVPDLKVLGVGERQRRLGVGHVVERHVVDLRILDLRRHVHVVRQVAIFLVEERLRGLAPAKKREHAQRPCSRAS